jgi:WD40 repeat protein
MNKKWKIIISCSLDGTFKSIKIFYLNKAYIFDNIIKAHNKGVYKVIELDNKKLASCSEDNTIKIWQREKGKYNLIRNLEKNVFTILSLKNNIIVYASFDNKSISFWDYEKNEIIKELSDIRTNGFINSISLINDNLLGVGGHEFIYLIDLKNYQILINYETISYVYSLLKLNNNTFLTGEDCGKIRNWELSQNMISLIDCREKILDNYITSIIQPDDNTLIFCSNSSFNENIEIYKINFD